MYCILGAPVSMLRGLQPPSAGPEPVEIFFLVMIHCSVYIINSSRS